MSNKTKNRELTQAEKIVHRWTGHYPPEMKKAKEVPVDPMKGFRARYILANDPMHQANPELAFGVARRMISHNAMKMSDFQWFMKNHPAWKQVWETAEKSDLNGDLYKDAEESERFKTDRRGRSRTITGTIETSTEVEITYMSRKGVKTEKVQLGFEMIRWKEDTRPFIALNLGGGSAARYHLMGLGEKPNYEINDDSKSRRYVDNRKGKTQEATEETDRLVSIEGEMSVSSFMSRLMSGETVTFHGDGGSSAPAQVVEASGKKTRKVDIRRKLN